MKDYININLGSLAKEATDAEKTAFAENACRKIAEAVGWKAEGADMYSPDGNAYFRYQVKALSNSGASANGKLFLATRIGTRHDKDSSWSNYGWNDGYLGTWGALIEGQTAYAVICKSVSGAAWTICLSDKPDTRTIQLAAFSNTEDRWFIRAYIVASGGALGFYNGTNVDSFKGIFGMSEYFTNREKTTLFPMPDQYHGSSFKDLYFISTVSGGSQSTGELYFADGAYYRCIAINTAIRVV